MVEVYRTEVVFSTTDELTQKLNAIVSSLRGADRVAKTLQQTLSGLNVGRIGLPPEGLFRSAGQAAGRAYAEGFAQAAGAGVRDAMAAAARGAGAAAARSGGGGGGMIGYSGGGGGGRLTGGGSGGIVPYGGGGGGGGSGMAGLFAAGAANNFGRGAGGGRGPGGGGGAGGGGGYGFGHMYGGHMLFRGGERLLEGIGRVGERGIEYEAAISRLRAQRFTDEELQQAVGASWRASAAVPTSRVTQNLEQMGELRYILGSADHAAHALTPTLRMAGVLSEFSGGRLGVGEAGQAVRAIELMQRANTEESLTQNMAQMTGAIVASGGTISPREIRNFAARTSQYSPAMSDEFLYQYAPRLIQMMHGDITGTSLTAMARQSVVGVAGQRTISNLQRLGLLKPDVQATVGQGTQMHLNPDALVGGELALTNPYEYIQQIIAPRLAGMTRLQQTRAIAGLYQTAPGQRAAADMLFGGRTLGGGENAPFERDARLARSVSGAGTYDDLLRANPRVQLAAFNAQWHNFTTALGATILPIVVPALRGMTDALVSMTQWARENPEAVQQILRIGAALGAAMIAVGAFAIAIGGLALIFALGTPVGMIGLFAAGIVGLATYLGTGALKAESFWNALTGVAHWLGLTQVSSDNLKGAFHWLQDAFQRVKDALSSVIAAVDNFGHSVRNLVSWLTLGAVPGLDPRQYPSTIPPYAGRPPFDPRSRPMNPGDELPGLPPGMATPPQKESYHPVNRGTPANIHTAVLLDGRVVARSTMRAMVAELGGPFEGGGGFDSSLLPYQQSQPV